VLHYLKPQDYKMISKNLNEKRLDREVYIHQIIEELDMMVAAEHIEAEISGRVKHIYSIWKKMTAKGKSFEELLDVRAVRVIVKNLSDCYRVLGMVHEKWPPLPREFDDYIANPKPNGYQSLHTAVLGPNNKAIEVQIRTRKMHEHAELGVAAHWHYKESDASLSQQAKLNRVRQLLDQEANSESTKELLDKDLFGENVYVLTPNREAIELVAGATPLDFAYQIHTNLGHRCRGAKVNGRIVPLTYVLNNGDEVEILTGKNASPSRDWLSPHLAYVKSNRTRAKIRGWFKQQAQEKNIAAGKQLLDREFSRLNLNLSPDALLKIAKKLNCNSVNELHAQLGSGEVTINQFLTRVPNMHVAEPAITPDSLIRPQTQSKSNDGGVRVQGVGNLLVQMATCCKPAPPEVIGGFVTINRGVVIHRKTCSNFINMVEQSPAREIDVDWGYDADQKVTSDLMIKAHPHHDLLKEVNNLITNEQLRIIDLSIKDDESDNAIIYATVELNHLNQLSRLIDRLIQLPFVIEAHRR
ncbi:MAG: RelA/SpoT family protein, partial [Wohlfahrtiimonas sp.]